jgi:hypothetical protein
MKFGSVLQNRKIGEGKENLAQAIGMPETFDIMPLGRIEQ